MRKPDFFTGQKSEQKIVFNPKIFAFSVSFAAVFLMVIIPHLGFKPSLLNPAPTKIDRFVNIKPRLEQIPNDFKLNQETSLIPQAHAQSFNSNSYVVIDFDTGKVLDSQNLSKKTPIASLTKIMTAIVALDLAKPEEVLSVSKRATQMEPSKVYLTEGEKLTVEELLNCFMLSSANDCAQATKDGIDKKYGVGPGEDSIFIQAMNEKASFLGLKNTHFVNPQGFDNPQHYSTSEDLAILSHYALKNYPLIAQIVAKPFEVLEASSNHPRYYLNNWNGLLGAYPGTMGMKIGNTDDAGYTTVVVSKRPDDQGNTHSVLTVLLGADKILDRDLWASELLDSGFQKAWGMEPVGLTEDDLRTKYATWHYE